MAPPKIPLELRFAKWTRKTETGCWEWLGQTGTHGYAYIKHDGKKRKAATVSFEWRNGPVPKELEISHLCGNALCVNPDHLVAETHSENLKRRRPYLRKVAKCGHELVDTGLFDRGRPVRRCEICYKAYQAEYRANQTKNPTKRVNGLWVVPN